MKHYCCTDCFLIKSKDDTGEYLHKSRSSALLSQDATPTSSCDQTELSVEYNKKRWDVTPFLLNEEISSVCIETMQTLK